MTPRHVPVLGPEVVSALAVRAGGAYVDCTVGGGGHAALVLSAAEPAPRVLGIDLDADALAAAREALGGFGPAVALRRGNYARVVEIAAEAGIERADGVVMDLGLSSMQLESAERGFSFMREARLDMRFDRGDVRSAWEVVNLTPPPELAALIRSLGEEPRARRIASAIAAARPIDTTTQLAAVVAGAAGGRGGRIHPATRTFQAVRIAVNGELDNLREGLAAAAGLLAPGGRLAVISYHSLEDRLVKGFMARESADCLCPPELAGCGCGHRASLRRVGRKPQRASETEIGANPRSRSARLRVAERLATGAGGRPAGPGGLGAPRSEER